jgi:Arc/MetJ-type ribon-helix-helix transcriptional regulator
MEKRLIFRLPDNMFEQANKAVKNGKAKTVSHLMRIALREFLEKN